MDDPGSVAARNGIRAPLNDQLRFVAIDQPSYDDKIDPEWDLVEAGPEEAMALNILRQSSRRWSRALYGVLIDRLVDAGARVVTWDLMFDQS